MRAPPFPKIYVVPAGEREMGGGRKNDEDSQVSVL